MWHMEDGLGVFPERNAQPDSDDAPVELWEVQRWSGRGEEVYRVLYSGSDESKARNTFNRTWAAMRQGKVRILCNWQIQREYNAPRCRSRW